jgi:hypothetical protein
MTKQILWINLIILVLILNPMRTFAQNEWKCLAQDSGNQEWTGESDYERAALNKALELCKKTSNDPISCRVAKESCQFFINGKSTSPMWQCVALDQMAKPWISNLYPQRDDAAIAAREYCQEKSGFPDTCYTNLMTCKNLNARE